MPVLTVIQCGFVVTVADHNGMSKPYKNAKDGAEQALPPVPAGPLPIIGSPL